MTTDQISSLQAAFDVLEFCNCKDHTQHVDSAKDSSELRALLLIDAKDYCEYAIENEDFIDDALIQNVAAIMYNDCVDRLLSYNK
jgi:hypothetical protein